MVQVNATLAQGYTLDPHEQSGRGIAGMAGPSAMSFFTVLTPPNTINAQNITVNPGDPEQLEFDRGLAESGIRPGDGSNALAVLNLQQSSMNAVRPRWTITIMVDHESWRAVNRQPPLSPIKPRWSRTSSSNSSVCPGVSLDAKRRIHPLQQVISRRRPSRALDEMLPIPSSMHGPRRPKQIDMRTMRFA